MQRELFSPLAIRSDQIGFLSGNVAAEQVEAHCSAYEESIASAGGITLAILGVGVNGHLAFNEPNSAWDSRTRRVELAPSTRERPGFPGGLDGPHHALTVGLKTILEAKHIVLLAHGAAKAKALAELLHGAPSLDWPITCLQDHAQVTVLADEEACALLAKPASG